MLRKGFIMGKTRSLINKFMTAIPKKIDQLVLQITQDMWRSRMVLNQLCRLGANIGGDTL
jgi:hypothetical protein